MDESKQGEARNERMKSITLMDDDEKTSKILVLDNQRMKWLTKIKKIFTGLIGSYFWKRSIHTKQTSLFQITSQKVFPSIIIHRFTNTFSLSGI